MKQIIERTNIIGCVACRQELKKRVGRKGYSNCYCGENKLGHIGENIRFVTGPLIGQTDTIWFSDEPVDPKLDI